eukprot:2076705-Amphidinium_carterae.1
MMKCSNVNTLRARKFALCNQLPAPTFHSSVVAKDIVDAPSSAPSTPNSAASCLMSAANWQVHIKLSVTLGYHMEQHGYAKPRIF